jgi:CRISPR type II-A-associated protein Csn2
MKLAYPLLEEPLVFEENAVNILVIEQPRELRKAVNSLRQQIAGETGDFVLSENFEPVELTKKAVFVTDLFDLPLESKKLAGKISHAACEAGEAFAESFQRIAADVNMLAAQIGMNMDFDVTFTPLENISALVEILKFHVDSEGMSYPEQLLVFMKLYRNFFGIKLFIFYNLKSCLDDEEIALLYRSICYEKFHVLMLEDCQRGKRFPEERTVIIDKDLCVF